MVPGGTQQQASGWFVGVALHCPPGVRLGLQAVEGIIGLHHGGIVCIGLTKLLTGSGIVGPGGSITSRRAFAAPAWRAISIRFRSATESREAHEVVGIIIAIDHGLHRGPPLGHLAATEVVAVVDGVAHGIRH